MSFGLLRDIAQNAPKNTALLGMDVGKKTIGLALSNPGQTIATPLTTIKRQKFSLDMQELAKIVKEYEIGGFVIGLPLNMDGTEGIRSQSIRDFARETPAGRHCVLPLQTPNALCRWPHPTPRRLPSAW